METKNFGYFLRAAITSIPKFLISVFLTAVN